MSEYRYTVCDNRHADDTRPPAVRLRTCDDAEVEAFIAQHPGREADYTVCEHVRAPRVEGGWRLVSSMPGDEWVSP